MIPFTEAKMHYLATRSRNGWQCWLPQHAGAVTPQHDIQEEADQAQHRNGVWSAAACAVPSLIISSTQLD